MVDLNNVTSIEMTNLCKGWTVAPYIIYDHENISKTHLKWSDEHNGHKQNIHTKFLEGKEKKIVWYKE